MVEICVSLKKKKKHCSLRTRKTQTFQQLQLKKNIVP